MQTNVESSQLIYVKNVSGNEIGKKITFEVDSGVLNLDECCINNIFNEVNTALSTIIRVNNCMHQYLKKCEIWLDGVQIANFNDLSQAENIYYEFKETEHKQHLVSSASPYSLDKTFYEKLTYASANAEISNCCHQMSFKHFFPYVFEDVEYLEINKYLEIEITLDYNSPDIEADPPAVVLQGYFLTDIPNNVPTYDAACTMQYKQIELVIEKYDETILQTIKPDNDLIKNVGQISFNDSKISFDIFENGMSREIFYIKNVNIDNLLTINTFADTAITGADIQLNGNELILGKTYQDVRTEFELWQKMETNAYMIDSSLPEAVNYEVDLKLGANVSVEIGVLYY